MTKLSKWVPLLKRTGRKASDVERVSMGSAGQGRHQRAGRAVGVHVDEEVTERTVMRRRRTTYVLEGDLEQPESPVVTDMGDVGMIRYEGVNADVRGEIGTSGVERPPDNCWAPTRDPEVWYHIPSNSYASKKYFNRGLS